MKKKIYLLDKNIGWKVFKELNDKLVKDSGPVPVQGDKALWHLLRENKIYCWFADDIKNDMGIGISLPKRYHNKKWEMNIIKSV